MKTLFFATLAVALHLCTAHVRLTFPPARYPDYDFLDNVRTGGPCGVPGEYDSRTCMRMQQRSAIAPRPELTAAWR